MCHQQRFKAIMKLYRQTYSFSRYWGLLVFIVIVSVSVNADPVTSLESRAGLCAFFLSFIIEFAIFLGLLGSFGIRIRRLLPVLVLINVPTWLMLRSFMDTFISANFEIWWKQIPYTAVYRGFYADMKEMVMIEFIIAMVEGLLIFLLMKCTWFRSSPCKKLSLITTLGISLIGNGISAIMPAIIYPMMGISLVQYIQTHLSSP